MKKSNAFYFVRTLVRGIVYTAIASLLLATFWVFYMAMWSLQYPY